MPKSTKGPEMGNMLNAEDDGDRQPFRSVWDEDPPPNVIQEPVGCEDGCVLPITKGRAGSPEMGGGESSEMGGGESSEMGGESSEMGGGESAEMGGGKLAEGTTGSRPDNALTENRAVVQNRAVASSSRAQNGQLANGHMVPRNPHPNIPEQDWLIMEKVRICIETGSRLKQANHMKEASEIFISGVELCQEARLCSVDAKIAIDSAHSRLLIELSFLNKADVFVAFELIEQAMDVTQHQKSEIMEHFKGCRLYFNTQLEDRKFILKNQRKLRQFAEDRVRIGREKLDAEDFIASVHYLDTAVMVLKALHAKNMVTNRQMGQVFLYRAIVCFRVSTVDFFIKEDWMQSAKEDIDEAIDYNDLNYDSLYWAAKISDKLGKSKKARWYAQKALESKADIEMMMIANCAQSCEEDDETTEMGSGSDTTSVMSYASTCTAPPIPVDMAWIPQNNSVQKTKQLDTHKRKTTKSSKRKFKVINRKGSQPVEPISHQKTKTTELRKHEEREADSAASFKAESKRRNIAGPSTSKSAGALPSRAVSTAMNQPHRKVAVAKPAPQRAAKELLGALSTKYEVMLTCGECFPHEADQPLHDCQHTCKETTLVLLQQGSATYQRVRPMPFRSIMDTLCESFINSIPCDERDKCPYPHSNDEQVMWRLCNAYHFTVTNFIEQLKTTSLRCCLVVRRLCHENKGCFVLYCTMCLKSSPPKYTKKKNRHSPFCEDNHPWERPVMVFETTSPEDEIKRNEICKKGKGEAREITEACQKLFEEGFKKEDIIQESNKVAQANKRPNANNGVVHDRLRQLSESRERTVSGSSCSEEGYNMDCPELLEMIGEIPYDGDVDSPEEGLEKDDQQDRRQRERYYDELTFETKEKMREFPTNYKLCTIELDGPHGARCRPLDPCDEMREIKISGRMNCGPSMAGDTVVVHVLNIELLDKEGETVPRGKVVGVTAHGFNRTAYNFICTVDQYQSNLMKPICGTAPKLHVLDNAVINEFPRNKKLQQAKVAVYKNGNQGFEKIVDLNLKCKHDRLFVVKYLQWGQGFIYPLGFVCAVLPAGTNIERAVDILNLMYQVPKPIPESDDAVHGYELLPAEMCKRKDLMDQHTVSIDPQGCKDIDDALSIRKIKGKKKSRFEVTIHIADVSEVVKKDDVIDTEARRRMTSYYPGGDRPAIHMLPDHLSQNRCSLKEGEERLALSVSVIIENDGSWDMKTGNICSSRIRNNAALTYRDAQDIINDNPSAARFDDDTQTTVAMLYRLAYKVREKRLNAGQHLCDLPDTLEDDGCPEAHNLVAEFMIMANKAVAQFLTSNYDGEVPLRHQGKPSDAELAAWNNANRQVQDVSLYFQQFKEMLELPAHTEPGAETMKVEPVEKATEVEPQAEGNQAEPCAEPQGIPIAKSTVHEIKLALSTSNEKRARHIFSTEMLHPLHAIAMSNWFKIQERAAYIHSGDPAFEDKGHYSLKADQYVQFTSPIRRYLDIVIHRLVKAKLLRENCPYTEQEIKRLCERANRITSRARRYDRATKLLEVTAALQKSGLFLPATTSTIDDGGIGVCVPFLRTMKSSEKTLRFSDMDVVDRPIVDENKSVELHFKKRIYDVDPDTLLARTKMESMNQMQLDSSSHVCHVAEEDWRDMQTTLEERPQDFRGKCESILLPLLKKYPPPDTVEDISSEMRGDKPIIRHHADFGLCVKRAGVVQIQVSTRNLQGMMSPMISLMNLTPHLDICLEHSKEPVACFAEIATKFTKDAYHSLEEYKEIWKPLISMESAQAAVQDGEPIVIHNVPISMHRSNNAYYGSFELNNYFCFVRHLKLLRNSKGDDEDSNDYLCIRIPIPISGKMGIQHRYRNVWLAHAVAMRVCTPSEDSVRLEFKLQRFSCAPPEDMLSERSEGSVKKLMIGTVEMLPKPLPFRRMDEAVDDLPKSTVLCKSIALGPSLILVEVDQAMKSVLPKDLKIQALSTGMPIAGKSVTVPMPPNNDKQNEAMTKALTQNFTVIQGPPGTGKTLTGVKLVYHFVQMNQKLSAKATGGTAKRQVLYCGPSNSAVDVAAKFLFERLGDKCPKIVRVYSETLEKHEFPIPRESLNVKARHRTFQLLGKDMHKEIALHHLVRKDGNRFAKDIRAFDSLFARNKNTPEEVSDEQLKEYSELLTDACMAEVVKYDVILATCSASPSNRISRGANVTQCIIDECGMCQEPESLIPLVTFKPKQVVLIGDHMQLRPIITNQVVKDLGMEKSLFERHAENAIMLDTQYRMHPAICRFPSEHFYDGKLITKSTMQWNNEYLDIWPVKHNPVVFCHVEGAERVLNVATADGNEQSKSNLAEVDHSVRIFCELINRYNVNPKKVCVLSQYKAQCAEISRQIKASGCDANVSTVVSSQGGEWDYVILSTVRSLPDYEIDRKPSFGWLKRHLGFITDHHQINVAITRAKRGMIIVGNSHLLVCDPMWKQLLENYHYRNLVLPAQDFPLVVGDYRDRKCQRGDYALRWSSAIDGLRRAEVERIKQQERYDRETWLRKQSSYSPYQ